jgi:hypothetical protein
MELKTSTTKAAVMMLTTAALAGMLTGCSGSEKAAETSTENSAETPVPGATQTEAGTPAASAAADKHDCKGLNSCKGKGGCHSSDNGCVGKNSCKGKGGCKHG